MDLTRCRTEAFARFLDFYQEFSRVFRLSIAALHHMSKVVDGPGGPKIGLLCRIRADSSSFRAAPDTVLAA